MDSYNNQTYYDILGVSENASLNNIQKAKDRLKFGNADDRAPFWMWAKIDEAYSVLSNHDKRKEYDEKLLTERNNSGSYEINSNVDEIKKGTVEDVIENNLTKQDNNPTPIINLEDNEIKVEPSPLSIEDKQQNKNEQLPEDNSKDYTSPFIPNISQKNEKEKFTKKQILGIVTSYFVLGPVGAVAIAVWLKKHKKIKLVKDDKPKNITKISTEEMALIEYYNQSLDQQINKLLSEKHNNYRLQIQETKYENQIEMLKQLLQYKMNTKNKKSFLKYKLDLVSTKMQLELSKSKLNEVRQKINDYNETQKSSKLTKLNEDIINNNKQISKLENSPVTVRKLNIYQNRLIKKRDRKAQYTKTSIVKELSVYNKFIKAKSFAKSLKYITLSSKDIDNYIIEEIDYEQNTKTH